MRYKVSLLFMLAFFSMLSVLGNNKLPTSCSSYFTWEPIEGTNTGIKFTNQSTGDFNSWEWDFGDGFTSTVYHPVHEYSSYGIYYVCLTISDGVSCTDVFCDTIVVEPDCVADFNFTYVPTTPIYVQFTDLSTGYPDVWLWNFGDGTTSTEQNPVHPFVTPGTYNVCLIIEHNDTVYSCADTICKTVIIPDSLNCQADFTYDIDPDNPMVVNFTDYSTGNITDWEWNFGDGNISYERNPVHIFPGPADYLVCLKVENSDSSEQCIHFICETISLEDPNFCTASFDVLADSNSQVMYHYSFLDKSSGNPDLWLWDFGDGHISHDQNPVHIYDGPGTYEVCLDTWNSSFPGCTDSHCMLVKTAEYYQLGGLAFIGDNPINNPTSTGDTGLAIIYRQNMDRSMLAIDTTRFHELGYYWFTNMMEMGYLMKISLTRGSVNYSSAIPSYYPGTMHWQDAEEIILSGDMFEMNTDLIQAEGVETGPGMISGHLIKEIRYGTESHYIFEQVPVILTDQQNRPLAWTATNELGYFTFENISLGSYLLHADIAGMWARIEAVNLTSGLPVHDSVRIQVYQESPFSVAEIKESINITSLYPNPTMDKIKMDIHADKNSSININVYNLTGDLLTNEQFTLTAGDNSIYINTADYPSGLYMISIFNHHCAEVISKKFVKK